MALYYYAERYVERFTVRPCSEKLVTTRTAYRYASEKTSTPAVFFTLHRLNSPPRITIEKRGTTCVKTLKCERFIGYTGVLQNLPKHYIIFPSITFSSVYPPRNVSEIKGEMAHGKQTRTHILSKLKKKSNISSIFFQPPSVRSQISADYYADPFTPNTTVSVAGISPQRIPTELPIWHQSSHLACNSNQKIKRTANCLFYPANNPPSQHTILPINTRILTIMTSKR